MFISNLQWWTTDAELEQLCAAYGRVRRQARNRVPLEQRTGAASRGACCIAASSGQRSQLPACCPCLQVTSIRFIDDKACGKSRGMAIVEFAEPDAASQCISGLSG